MIRATLLCIFLLGALSGSGQSECTLELSRDSINVYTCTRADSRYKTIKTTFTLQSSLSQLAAAVLDIDNYASWQYKTARVNVLKKISDSEVVYYTEVEAPALTSNRDFVIRLTVDPDPMTKGMIIEAVSLPDFTPPVDGVIRVPYSRARWTVVPVGQDRLSIEYTIDIDLGGSVPPWLVNLFAAKAPYETFRSLRDQIGRYSGQQVSFIK